MFFLAAGVLSQGEFGRVLTMNFSDFSVSCFLKNLVAIPTAEVC